MIVRGIEVKYTQGSPEWLQWRSTGIGGSDAGSVSGASPFKDAEQLWKEKTGREQPSFSDVALARMDRGSQLEPVARALYERQTGIYMRPATYEHSHYPFLKASLDGINRRGDILLEIKVPSKADVHTKALAGEVAEYYRAQLIHNMMVTGVKEAHFFTYFPAWEETQPEKAYALVRLVRGVDITEQEMQDYMRKARAFWTHVENDIPPGSDEVPTGTAIGRLGLVSLSAYARAGKDTVGNLITGHFGARRYAYADKLKETAIKLGLWDGLEETKEAARPHLIALGDELRRVYPDIWVQGVFNEASGIFDIMQGAGAVITDTRKTNEVVNASRVAEEFDVPHKLIWVERPGVGPVHESERDETRHLKNMADRIIVNDVDIHDDANALLMATFTALSPAGPRVVRASSYKKQLKQAA